ncbi:putative Beta-ketoacyl synthase [uncultured delta proteobacterium]|uniref:Putative Beta-ketoacyl synthase n=1 Tax=uncultured delta proteobacterium TaxID=34034 RepID=A0A212JFJ7_9DELT|nr:putative Beta-ketoacyl synthase [uncultured delta proteobacterium]
MSMVIEGLSCFGAFGSGPKALNDALDAAMKAALSGQSPVFSPEVDTAPLTRFIPARALRQCDRFSRLALLGAYTALEDAGIDPASLADATRYGIILAGGYGTASPTLEFIDSLVDFGEAMASPLAFSHSVHNIPAAIIAKNLGMTGPCSTVCQLEVSVAAGLLLAQTWLGEGRVDRVLFGAVEEVTPALAAITAKLVAEKGGGASISKDDTLPTRKDRPVTDGAVFFCLSRGGGKSLGRIESVVMGNDLDMDAACAVPSGPAACFLSGHVSPAARRACGGLDGSAAYGNIPVAQAFDCVAALSLLGREANAGKRIVCVERGLDMHSAVTLAGGGT